MAEETERCKWTHPLATAYRCQEVPVSCSKQGYCIFHQQSKDKDAEAFLDGIERKRDNHDFDFSGYYFPISVLAFEGFEFDQDVSFSFATFCGLNTVFSGARFSGKKTDFSFAEFSGTDAKFITTVFEGEQVNFQSACFFGEGTNFGRAEFRAEETIFGHANFSGRYTHFGRTLFSGRKADFTYAEFAATETGFNDAAFMCQEANFRSARFLSAWTDFTGSELGACTFVYARWRKVDFGGASWNSSRRRRCICSDELKANSSEDYAKAAGVCRNIKQAYRDTGDYGAAGLFFYGEMECIRQSMQHSPRRFGLAVLKLVCGYGERPFSVIRTWTVVLAFFAVLYAFSGITTDGATTRLVFGGLSEWISSPLAQLKNIAEHLWYCVYFSGVTFTTLGYGDIHPAGTLTQIFAVAEASLGAFLMALFILVVGRKLLR